ncbi:MAG: hypothetical protein HQM03_18125 [Magnetococcales bacterium]|nr:hypothetical protein [Magnetococcales bacterium]
MSDRLCIFCCQNYRLEMESVARDEQWDDVVIVAYPARCGDPPVTWEELAPLLPAGCTEVMLLGGYCLAGLSEPPGHWPPTLLSRQDDCKQLLAGESLIADAVARSVRVVVPNQLREEAARLLVRDRSERTGELLLLDTGSFPEAVARLESLASGQGLRVRCLAVGLDHIRLLLTRIVTERRLRRERREMRLMEHRHACEVSNLTSSLALLGAEARQAFMARMSHELRTPLNAIMGLSYLLLESASAADHRDHLQTIHAAGGQLLRLIDDLLDYSRIDSGILPLAPAPFDPRALLERVAEEFGSKVARKPALAMRVAIAADLPACLLGDGVRLAQVLDNLCDNAVKFTERGEVGIEVAWSLSGPGEATLRCCVWDTGIGFAPERIGELLKPFGQADSSNTRAHGGAGLGLTISHKLVQWMGGSMLVESAPGRGSKFTCIIACAICPGEVAGSGQDAGRLVLALREIAALLDRRDIRCLDRFAAIRVELEAYPQAMAHVTRLQAALERLESRTAGEALRELIDVLLGNKEFNYG